VTTGFIGNRTLLAAEAALAEAETMTTAEVAQLVLAAELAGVDYGEFSPNWLRKTGP
jgi:hypothetical protein